MSERPSNIAKNGALSKSWPPVTSRTRKGGAALRAGAAPCAGLGIADKHTARPIAVIFVIISVLPKSRRPDAADVSCLSIYSAPSDLR
jgi:hypothetical protein